MHHESLNVSISRPTSCTFMLNMGQQARIALDFSGAENGDSRLILEVVCSLCTHVRSRTGQRDLHMAQLHLTVCGTLAE